MYELITIGGGEYFVDIFNGLAMLVKSGDYLNVVEIAASLAFMIAIINAALSGSLYDSSKWFVVTFIVIQTLLYPKATLQITDKTNPALNGATVDNVPFVIAYTASTASQIGYSLTKQFESVYSLPDDLQYTQNGMIFGVNLWQSMQQSTITNANLAASVDSFIQNCIFFDIEYGIYSFDDLKNSDDIWSLVKANQVENRFFTYINQGGETSYPTCKAGASSLDTDWNNQYNSADLLKNLSFAARKPDLTKTILSNAAPLATDYFFEISKTSNQVLQQAMMINAINTATENYEAENQIQSYQNARASLQTKSTYQTMGTQAGMWIPILKIVIEAVFYAAFPLVVLVSLIPSMTGTVLRSYFTTFFWLAAWGPIYTILHRISMGHGTTYTLGLGEGLGLTLANQPALEQTMSNIAAMAGYMSMFVPMLAFGIARGGAAAMSSMTTSFMAGVQSSVSAAASEGTTGNISMGNVTMGQRHAYAGISVTNDAGQVINRHNDGTSSIDNSGVESRLGFDVRGSERMESALSSQVSNEQSLAQTKSIQAAQTKAHGFEMMINNHRSIESSNGFEQNLSSEEKSAFSRINNAVSDFAQEHGITREKSAEVLAGIGIGANLGVGGSVGQKGSASGSTSFSGNAQFAGRSSDQDHYKAAINYSNQHSLSKDFATVESAMQSSRFNFSDSRGESINETFNNATSLSRESGQHFENAKRYSEQQQSIRSHSAEIDRNYNQELWGELVNKYGEKEAAEITNPSNHNKTILNQEMKEFVKDRFGEIGNIHKPNLAAEYRNEEVSFGKSHNPIQGNNHNPYKFSEDTKQIDNSGLQGVTSGKFIDTQQEIDHAKKNNSEIGNEVISRVKKEEDEGLF